MRIGFLGAGRLAAGLAWALARSGASVVAVSSRSGATAHGLAARIDGCSAMATAQDVVNACDLVFVAVPDGEIAAVAASVQWRRGMAAVHCSAATERVALQAAVAQGALAGGFHPLQTFGDPEAAARTLPGCSIAIEADEPLRGQLEELARLLACPPLRLPPGSRPRYHAGAHYAAGFVFALLQEAAQIWQTFGIAREDAVAALVPLLRGTAAAMEHSGLPQGMPGIFSRGDVDTLRRHLDALQADAPDALPLYCELGLRSLPLGLERGGLPAEAAARMRALLQAAVKR